MPTNGLAPLLGRHTTLFQIQGATVNDSTGLWTLDATVGAIVLALYTDAFDAGTETETERIEGYITATRNPVGVCTGTTATVAEIMRRVAPYSYLEKIYFTDTHIVITETQGAARVFYGIIVSGHRTPARGKNVFVLGVETVDISTANPTVTFT